MSLPCVIVEDQTMFRQMLHNMVQTTPDLRVVAAVASEKEGIAACERHRPDLLLLDLALPDGHGVNVARRLARLNPAAKIIILSGEASTFVCPSGLQTSVHAVLDKTQAFDDLAAELKALLPKARGGSSSARSSDVRDRLSGREYEIFLLVGRGLMSKEIADKLGTTGSEFVQLAIKHYQSTLGSKS